jgi:hypothetical protein
MMGQRSAELANRFEQAVNDLASEIEGCSDARWNAVSGDEGWTVAGLAQHIAGQFPLEMEFIVAGAEGKPMPTYTWDDINGKNDKRYAANMKATKADVLKLLRDGAPGVAGYLRGLSDEQLDRKSALPLADGAMVSTQQLIEGGVLIDHVNGHLKSMRSAGAAA